MRIFRVGSKNKNRKVRKQNSFSSRQQNVPIEITPSIGSELAASDQFEILVAKKKDNVGEQSQQPQLHRKKSKNSFLSYFSSDNDDSTVSSITTGEYGGFFYNTNTNGKKPSYYNATNAAAESISSWCCCGDSEKTLNTNVTRRTHPSSTDNTLIQNSAYGTIQPTDSRSLYRSVYGSGATYGGNSRCCGPDLQPQNQRQRSFLFSSYYWGRNRQMKNHRNISNSNLNGIQLSRSNSIKNAPNMSASLFDNLSEDEMDINISRSTSFTGSRRLLLHHRDGIQQHQPSKSQQQQQPVTLRRVLTWSRKTVL